jgi:DNA-binding response OmpR family regulator
MSTLHQPEQPVRSRVLIVEDDEGIRLGLADLVEDLADASTVGTVSQAYQAFKGSRFDLVIADLRIGSSASGGREMVAAARENLSASAVMSGVQLHELRAALTDLSPDALITKPFQMEAVLGLVERVIALRRRTEALGRGQLRSELIKVAPGLERTTDPEGGEWFKLSTETRLPVLETKGMFVVDGTVRVGTASRKQGEYFLASMGQAVVAQSSCLLAVMPKEW